MFERIGESKLCIATAHRCLASLMPRCVRNYRKPFDILAAGVKTETFLGERPDFLNVEFLTAYSQNWFS
jgi:hypothetical protein